MCTFAITCVQWLTEVFLLYLEEWETSVSERSGFTKIKKGMMLLSRETRLGLKITGWLQMTTNITQNFNVKIRPLFFSVKLGFSCFKGCANIIIPLQCSPLWNWSSMYSRYQGCPSFSVTKYVKIPLKAFLVN